MTDPTDHRAQAESALANAQRNPVLSAEQSFLSAQVHALLAVEHQLEEIAVALGDARSPQSPAPVEHKQNGAGTNGQSLAHAKPRPEMRDALDRAADDGWPDGAMHNGSRTGR